MKADANRLRQAIARPSDDIRLVLLFGPDEAGAADHARRMQVAMGDKVERVDLDGATLRGDPARLTDEAAALSLFGDRRIIRVTATGEESLAAVESLLNAERAGNPVVAIGPALKATGKLVKLVIAARNALAFACYAPSGREASALVRAIARDHGLEVDGHVADGIVAATGGDRAIIAREIEKFAHYLDAAPDRPATIDQEAVVAVGAAIVDTRVGDIVNAVIARDASALTAALRDASETGESPIMWLRALARRIAALIDMRIEVAEGGDVGAVMKRHRVFWKEEAMTAAALRRWSVAALTEAFHLVRTTERQVMTSGATGATIADQMAVDLAR